MLEVKRVGESISCLTTTGHTCYDKTTVDRNEGMYAAVLPQCFVSDYYASVCACAYGSVFACLSVCVDCYSCSRINEVEVRVSIGF